MVLSVKLRHVCVALIVFMFMDFSAQAEKKKLSHAEYDKKAELRIKNFKLPEGMKVELWADESQTTNPAAIYFDSQGRLFVTEIHRWRFGVDDIRQRKFMLDEDIAIQNSEDRVKMFKNHLDKAPMNKLKNPMDWYTQKADEIRILEDTDGNGRADKETLYAGDFNDPLDGPGIGVIERDGKVYYTNIPHLWVLEDKDGDGVAESRKSLQDGFGIRMSFSGHDMHGLVWGPDGKLYWSIGDRGFSFTTKEGKKFHGPNEGAAFRCNPDGSDLEVFYDRLRNPQELAFDDYGNLFTADNDGDGSDLERINYLVEGGDTGWHAGHQSIMSFTNDYKFRSNITTGEKKLMNPWETEEMWKVPFEGQPEFILPGIGQINGGPSGFVFNPSNSLGKKYDDKFFVIHFKGSVSRTSVTMFDVEDHGAGFKTANHELFFSGSNCVDIDFGPDGKLYISDYNYSGWLNQDVGNIYTMFIPEALNTPEVKENEKLLTSDYSKFDNAKLYKLLSRDHQRIRQAAQFEIAKRSTEGKKLFLKAATDKSADTFTRIHGIWGLGQMAYTDKSVDLSPLMTLIKDANDQVRIQSARVLGDHRVKAAEGVLVEALNDKHARTAMYAGIGLGRIASSKADPALVEVLRRNENKDRFLRHGMIMGLAGVKDKSLYTKYIKDESSAVRIGILLTLRRFKDAQIAEFLNDTEQFIAYEAIRAINDLPIKGATSALAKVLDKYATGNVEIKSNIDKLMQHRLINANYYSATAADAARLLKYAANPSVPERQRIEALAAIENWNDSHKMDNTTGLLRAQPAKRDDISEVVKANAAGVFKTAKGKVLAVATRVAGKFGYELSSEILTAQLLDANTATEVRTEAFNGLIKRNEKGLDAVATKLLKDKNQEIKDKALGVLMTLNPAAATTAALDLAQKGSVKDKQNAFKLLASQADDRVKALLMSELDKIINGATDSPIALDVIEATRMRQESDLKAKLAKYESSINPTDMMAKFATALNGGDVAKGKDIFLNHGAAQCIRCHKVNGYGADVGPDLSTLAKDRDRRYILESIVDPGAAVAPGFGMITMSLKDGKSVGGTFMKETKTEIHVKDPAGKISKYKKTDIASKTKPISGMPPMHFLLKPMEIRDLTAYLATLKKAQKKKKGKGHH
ncbi:MAG: HEAT repeat domain-containing protein [Lentisphaerales bacterium]|nr:HEAT repeat domain-containing protein [Lentisphaerales bacterium]